jgi:hypothetical protein
MTTVKIICKEDENSCGANFSVRPNQIKTKKLVETEEITQRVDSNFYKQREEAGQNLDILAELRYEYKPTGKYRTYKKIQKYCVCPVCKNKVVIHEIRNYGEDDE